MRVVAAVEAREPLVEKPKPFILHKGDCLEVIRTLADCSIDAVVTDPPYALTSGNSAVDWSAFGPNGEKRPNIGPTNGAGRGHKAKSGFMGKAWDTGDVAFAVEFWREVLRVLKPGGHLVAFGGSRTYHRLACAIEDAGFEIRDQLQWIYGQGFPKSLDVSKQIDKAAGAEREVIGTIRKTPSAGSANMNEGWVRPWAEGKTTMEITTPATAAACQWEGWGTALKPAHEPIVLARKPLSEKTVAANVLRWGTGALNIDATRIKTTDSLSGGMVYMGRPKASEGWDQPWMHDPEVTERKKGESAAKVQHAEALGRWPANLCHDGSPEVLAGFPDSNSSQPRERSESRARQMDYHMTGGAGGFGDSGSAARFFFSAKADKNDRIASKHPTVKPVALMQWLVRLITPPGGTVLDPFAGSGATGEAAWREGFSAILIEREAEYLADIARRMEHVQKSQRERRQTIAMARVETAGPLFEAAE